MIDKVFVAAALLQTVVTTLRAGSRALYMYRTGGIGVMDGPLIMPPNSANNESANSDDAFLWELSTAFRHGVLLQARPDLYTTDYVETSLSDLQDTHDAAMSSRTSEAYQMSTYGGSRQQPRGKNDELDEWIEEILLEEQQQQQQQDLSTNETLAVVDDEGDDSDNSVKETLDQERRTHAQVSAIENEIIAELVETTQNSSEGFFTRINQQLSNAGKSLRKDILKRWRRVEGDLDELFEEEIDEEIASATSFVTQVDIGAEMTIPKKASVYAYAPEIFRDLRRFFGVSESQYLHSILESGPFVSFQSNSKGAARVGGVFLFTRDGAYLIKSIKRDEVGAFLRILMRYYNFMKRNGRRSLLTRFCGMYEIELPVSGGKTTTRRETLVVMNSVFPVEAEKFISERFDLKGSTTGRECSIEEKLAKGSSAVLKDLDLAREVELLQSLRQHHGPKDVPVGLHIGPTAKASFLTQLRRDVQLLVDCKLIDYSLLVGVVLQTPTGPSMQDLVVASFSDGMDKELFQQQELKNAVIQGLLKPVRTLLAPPAFLAKTAAVSLRRVATWPLPYYGSELCGVDAGRLSRIQGERLGRKALFYFGLIDFLQPFNWKKELEWKWKSLRYGEGFSCVPPEEYARRFIDFIDRHVT